MKLALECKHTRPLVHTRDMHTHNRLGSRESKSMSERSDEPSSSGCCWVMGRGHGSGRSPPAAVSISTRNLQVVEHSHVLLSAEHTNTTHTNVALRQLCARSPTCVAVAARCAQYDQPLPTEERQPRLRRACAAGEDRVGRQAGVVGLTFVPALTDEKHTNSQRQFFPAQTCQRDLQSSNIARSDSFDGRITSHTSPQHRYPPRNPPPPLCGSTAGWTTAARVLHRGP
jgi:hypothetical protein